MRRQVRPSEEEVLPPIAGSAAVLDYDLQIWTDTQELFGIRPNRVSHVQCVREGARRLSCVQVCCVRARLCGQVFEEPALKKAKRSVDKALNFKRRERMFISRFGTWRCVYLLLSSVE
jgi:hypothetical protein